MKHRKSIRILSALLALTLLLAIVPQLSLAADAAETSGKCGDNLTWSFDAGSGTLTISGYGVMDNWGSDDQVPWYRYVGQITKLSLPEGLTGIGQYAFYGCNSLEAVTIPDSMTYIGKYAFQFCSSLEAVTIPNNVLHIDKSAFQNCTSLREASIGTGTARIEEGAFRDCSALEKAAIWNPTCDFPENSTTISDAALGKTVIYGFKGSSAEMYAIKWGYAFKALTPQFEDVAEGEYYAAPVRWAVDLGITTGTSDTTFSPDSTCTRAQVVTFLWRAAGEPEPSGANNPFADVKPNDYYYKSVLWAVEKGITTGTSSDKFSPNAGCTRGQVVTFLWRAEGRSASGSIASPFTDVNLDEYYGLAVLWAVENGVTNGTSPTTFSPNLACTRAQIVTFLYRALSDKDEAPTKVDLAEMAKYGTFAYTDEGLSKKYSTEIAANVGDHALTYAMLQIFYWSTVYNDLNENLDYLSLRGPDVNRPFAEQYYSKDATWEQYYLQIALDYYLQNVALAEEAKKNGVTVSKETQQMIDALPENLAAQASMYGYASVEDYLTMSFGPCVKMQDYLDYYSMTMLAYTYARRITEGITVTDEEIADFYARNAALYAQAGVEQNDPAVAADAKYEQFNKIIDDLFSRYELKVDYKHLHLYDIVSRSIAWDAEAATGT